MLALVGSGEYLPAMEPVDRYLIELLQPPVRVVCIPTAAGTEGEDRLRYWLDLGAAHFNHLGVEVESLPIRDRDHAKDPAFAAKIRQSNLVYLSGGRPDYLYRSLRDTAAWQAILDVHQSGGLIAGCSAGAMVLGARMPGFPHLSSAFGLVPFSLVIPHFDELPAIIKKVFRLLTPRSLTMIGIDGDTALVIDDHGWQVRGRKTVTIWKNGGKTVLNQGQVDPALIVFPAEQDK